MGGSNRNNDGRKRNSSSSSSKGKACPSQDEEVSSPSKKVPKQGGDEEKLVTCLASMLNYHLREAGGITFQQLAKDLDFHERTKGWVAIWKHAKDDGLIEEESHNKWVISEKGKSQAPKTQEFLDAERDRKFPPQNNDEYQARIRKKLDVKGVQIFDLLLKHGSLSKATMAGMLTVKPGSHKFFYADQNLRKLGYIEPDPADKTKRRLADKAFMNPGDRPDAEDPDNEVVAKAIKYATTKNKDSNVPKEPKEKATINEKKVTAAAFKNFTKQFRAPVQKDNPEMSLGEVTRKLGEMWAALSDDKKREFYPVASSGDGDGNKDFHEDDEGGESAGNVTAGVGDDTNGEPESPRERKTLKKKGANNGVQTNKVLSLSTEVHCVDSDTSAPVEGGDNGNDDSEIESKGHYEDTSASIGESDNEPGLIHLE